MRHFSGLGSSIWVRPNTAPRIIVAPATAPHRLPPFPEPKGNPEERAIDESGRFSSYSLFNT
ncbi:MAG: hypothetical protein R3Y40_06485 [Eubacteriales bacterium]